MARASAPPSRNAILRRRVRESPDRKSRRDLHPRRENPQGDGDRLRRRLLGDRARRPARPACRRGLSARPRHPGGELPERREDPPGSPGRRRRGHPPGLRLPGGKRTLCGGCREGEAHLDRSASEGDRGDGLEDRGAPDHAEGGRADRPRRHRAGRGRRGCQEEGERDRLPDRGQSGRRRRRQGLSRGDGGERARGGLRGRRARGREVLQRSDRLPRALPGGPAPRRGPGARRFEGQRDPPRGARLLDPAPPPEADRGVTRPEGRRGDARADRQDRHRRGRRGRLSLGGHRRGPPGRRRLLLPRDEHPRPGRALRHRDGHRLRHRARAGQDRRRREALDHPGGGRTPRPCDRVPDQRRGRPQELRSGAGTDHDLPRARGPRRPGRFRGRGGRRGDADVRPDVRQADRLGPRPGEGDGPDAPRPRRVRDRRHHHSRPLPPGPAGDEAVGQRRDLPRPHRGPGLAQVARARNRSRPRWRGGGRGRQDRAQLPGRGRRQALRCQGDRGGGAALPPRRIPGPGCASRPGASAQAAGQPPPVAART